MIKYSGNHTPVLVFFTLLILLSSCHVGRFFWWNFADLGDGEKFQSLPVDKPASTFYFYSSGNEQFKIPSENNSQGKWQSFEEFLIDHSTVAFLVLRNDTIIYENYFDKYSSESLIPSFSVSKAFVSALTGIAIGEGYIKSVEDPVTNYLTFLKNPGFDKITIEHLLNMRSGIKFRESYATPFADAPRYYYGRNLRKYVTKLKTEQNPDKIYNYLSVNTLLLSMIIEKASGQKLNDYLEAKIWRPLGMEREATWSIDSRKHRIIKSFCCINAIARDYLKFGKLYLDNGVWNDLQVIPEEWVIRSRSIMNDSKDSQGYPYTYQWRVDGEHGFFAKGILGQYIIFFPQKGIVIVRLGKKYAGIDWYDLSKKLTDQL